MGFKLPELHKDTKPALLGAVAGAIVITWTGFDALGWQTSKAQEALSKRQAESSVATALGRVCSAQFRSAASFPTRLAELQKIDRYSRADYLTKSGFATMPGEKEPTQGVSEACALLLIPEKS